MISPQEAIFRLKDGNRRFLTTLRSPDSHLTLTGRIELAATQQPFAIILGCSDSRVPVELIFDQSVGDLFVIRVAGNIAAPSQLGSIEYAAEQFGTRLVVVLGHTRCGAIEATYNELCRAGGLTSENLLGIVNRLKPSFDGAALGSSGNDATALQRRAVRENVRASVRQISENSPAIRRLMRESDLRVVGAEYAIETGVVDFFDGVGDALRTAPEAS